MTNSEIAEIFYKIAEILEIQEANPFRVRAYQRAAQTIESLSQDLNKIYKEGGLKILDKIPGIGKDLALKIEELVKTGRLKFFSQLKKKVPAGLLEIMEVEGMGPKTTKLVWKKFKVKNVKDLEKLAKSGKLAKLKGFKKKTEENILRGIEMRRKFGERALLGQVYPLAENIVQALKKSKLVERVEIAGSLRRKRETIGDIDILATSKQPKGAIDFFCRLPQIKTVIAKGLTKSNVILTSGIEADLRVVAPESFGAALYYFTGSKAHNIHTRKMAIKKGLTINEYGVFKGTKSKKGRRIAGRTEEEVFKVIGLPWMPPEIREDRGEIEAGLKNKLPKVVELKDIKGDLQVHSNWSDGTTSILEMARAAKDLGYEYIAIADHASRMGMVRGVKPNNYKKYLKEIKEADKKVKGIKVLAGVEVDIEKDGSLFLPDRILREFDFVLAAVHSNFKQSKTEMTKRIIKAIENPYVHALAHPSGRLLGRRAPIEFDLEAVLKAARETGTIMEINAHPSRLDLNDVQARQAKEMGVKIEISTDAHLPQELGLMYYGVAQARRGWLGKKDVVNTLSLEQFFKILKRK